MFELSNYAWDTVNPKVYESRGLELYTFNNDFKFPLHPEWRRIGVNLSGGADSAVGTSILCEIIRREQLPIKLFVITTVRCWNTRPWQGPISIEVYNKLKDKYPEIICSRHEGFVAPMLEEGVSGPNLVNGRSGDQETINSYSSYLRYTLKLDAVYNFTTNNPPNDDFYHPHSPIKRNWTKEKVDDYINKVGLVPQADDISAIQPFRLVSKDFIVWLYNTNGWRDLFEYTRSCEGDLHFYNMLLTDYDPADPYSVEECGQCYWCAERNWAKAKNNYE